VHTGRGVEHAARENVMRRYSHDRTVD
jgi:hypothetical protein